MAVNKRLIGAGAAGGAFVNDQNFRVVTYTGNGGSQAITGVGFKPDFVWHKCRNTGGTDHNITDSSRGVMKGLNPNTTAVEGNQSPLGVTSFDSDGFTVNDNSGGGAGVNGSGKTYVAWCWKANGGTTSSNSDGAVTTTVQANQAAGFSIVQFTGTGSETTFGHGLGSTPDVIIIKRLDSTSEWSFYHDVIDGSLDLLYLNLDAANSNSSRPIWDSSVFYWVNSGNHIAYCFKDVATYQEFDKYSGNGSASGPIVNIGFEPAFLMIKRTDSSDNWTMYDNKRTTTNPRNLALFSNLGSAELSSGLDVDFLSNGFQIKSSDNSLNNSSGTYFYWAIAANPDEEAPTLASSFNIETYGGNSSTNSITGLGFQPNFIWLKERSGTDRHVLIDSIRGQDSQLSSNNNDAETTFASNFDSFDTDGFTLGSATETNGDGEDYVAWTWKADDAEPTINTNGSITSITSVNDNAGFSIVKYVGTGSNATVGHGLSSSPSMIIIKRIDGGAGFNWIVGHSAMSFTSNETLTLDSNTTKATFNYFNATNPTSTVFSLGTGANTGSTNTNGGNYIAYCFSEVSNYQKFGSYTGNNTDDTAITVGFQPDFVVIKGIDTAENWSIMDSRRGGQVRMYANTNDDDENTAGFRFSSNGFVIPRFGSFNNNGSTFLYWAIAKNVPSINTLANSFKTVTYTGTGSAQSITGLGFKPDLTWFKDRGNVREHILSDSVRGAGREISPNTADAEETDRGVGSFDTDGFSFTDGNTNYNASSQNYVAWCWKAGNQWQLNTDGAINSTINANTGNGFSIVRYHGTGSATTVGHGLGAAPEWIVVKNLSNSHSGNAHWAVYHTGVGETKVIYLNRDVAEGTSSAFWNDTAPTSSVFSIGTDNDVNVDGENFIAYCWDSVSGFSKFGSYTGNGSTQSITGLGFQPDWLMIKQTNATNSWRIFDSVRGLTSPQTLFANLDSQEDSESNTVSSFDSDGFTMGSQQGVNDSGDTYIYMAFKMN